MLGGRGNAMSCNQVCPKCARCLKVAGIYHSNFGVDSRDGKTFLPTITCFCGTKFEAVEYENSVSPKELGRNGDGV